MTIVGLRLPKSLTSDDEPAEPEPETLVEWRDRIIEERPDADEVKRFIVAADQVYSSCRSITERRKADTKKISEC